MRDPSHGDRKGRSLKVKRHAVFADFSVFGRTEDFELSFFRRKAQADFRIFSQFLGWDIEESELEGVEE